MRFMEENILQINQMVMIQFNVPYSTNARLQKIVTLSVSHAKQCTARTYSQEGCVYPSDIDCCAKQ